MPDVPDFDEAAPVRPDPGALAAWRSFLRAHAVVTRRLEADLLAEHELPLASYDVLVQLVDADDHRLRMTELAESVLLSRSGLSRLVDRMQSEGLVERMAAAEDGRGMYAALTPTGYQRLRRASRTHLRGVADYMTGQLDVEELAALRAIMDRVAAGQSGPVPPPQP